MIKRRYSRVGEILCAHVRPRLARLCGLFAACATAIVSPDIPAQEVTDHVPGRILLKFRPGVSEGKKLAYTMLQGSRERSRIPQIGVHVIDLPPNANEQAFIKTYQGKPEIAFVELDRYCVPTMAPNDTQYPAQWHLAAIDAPAAWDVTTGTSNVIIACLDSGIDGSHPDLASQIVTGWNMASGTSNTADYVGHGTAVAGTAAAAGNNAIGVASVCWGARILPIKVTSCETCTGSSYSLIASGVTWAADHGARVVNTSFAVANGNSTLDTAIKYLQSKRGVFICGSGNSGTFDSTANDPYMITVGATTSTDGIASFSTYGTPIDLTAPGAGILTTVLGGSYSSVSGTSYSGPVVSGVAALVIAVNPNLTSQQIENVLTQSAEDLGTRGWDQYYGWGRVNAARAVKMAAGYVTTRDTTPPIVSITSPANGATVSGNVIVRISATDNMGVSSVNLGADNALITSDIAPPYEFYWDTTNLAPGSHTLIATARDEAGNSANTAISVTVNGPTPPPPADTMAPSVTITSPTSGTSLGSGQIAVSVAAADNIGVVKVELYVDRSTQATAVSTSVPFTTKWNPRKATNGAHTLQCKAFDAAGNAGLSSEVTVYK